MVSQDATAASMKTSAVVPQVRMYVRRRLQASCLLHWHHNIFTRAYLPSAGKSSLRALQVPKNAKGGIRVCEEELKAAFDFFDVDMKGVITASNLRKRLGAFHRSLSARVRA